MSTNQYLYKVASYVVSGRNRKSLPMAEDVSFREVPVPATSGSWYKKPYSKIEPLTYNTFRSHLGTPPASLLNFDHNVAKLGKKLAVPAALAAVSAGSGYALTRYLGSKEEKNAKAN